MLEPVHCQHAVVCAGCPLIDLAYDQQLVRKRERVRAALDAYPQLHSLPVAPIAGALSVTGYRVRAKLMVGGAQEGGPVIGLYAKTDAEQADDHLVVDIPGCLVLTPALADAASALRQVLRAPPPATGSVLTASAAGGQLSAIDLREVEHEGERSVLLTLVLAEGCAPDQANLVASADLLRATLPRIAGVAVNFRRADSPQVLGGTTRVLAGVREARDSAAGVYHLATYGAFTQANRAQAAQLGELIARQLAAQGTLANQRVLELYAGSGALSMPLAARGARMTLVESFAPAAQAASRAAAAQRLAVEVRTGDAARVAREFASAGARFDAVLVNPPRRGLSPEARRAAADLAPSCIVYVSCDPETMARDLAHLLRLGYAPEELTPVDMMPLTDQVESVALLFRSTPAAAVTLYRDADVHIVELHAYDAVPPPPSPGDRLAGAVGLPGSGLAVWTHHPNDQALWQGSLARARRQHLVLARGLTAAKGVLRSGSRFRRLAILHGHSLISTSSQGDVARDLARIGHPIVGDIQHGHGPTNRHFEEKYALDRPFVHAQQVELHHPKSGATLTLAPALPGELAQVLARLGYVFTSKSLSD